MPTPDKTRRDTLCHLLAAGALALPVAASLSEPAAAAQPNMDAALVSLSAARASLVAATPNKGGHRERAIALVDQAIAETKAGIAFAG